MGVSARARISLFADRGSHSDGVGGKIVPQAIGALILEAISVTAADLAVSATTFAAIETVIGATVLAAASYAGSALLAPGGPKSSEGQLTLQQPVPFRRRIYGRAKIGGYFIFWTSKNSNLYQVIAISSGEITAIIEHWLGDRRVVLSTDEIRGDGWVLAVDYPLNADANQFNLHGDLPSPSDPSFNPQDQSGSLDLRILSRLGTDDQVAYQQLIDVFPGIWTSSHKGLGIADVFFASEGG